MSDEIRQVLPTGDGEARERLTDDPDVRGVEVVRAGEAGGWQVTVWVMEFLREDPLETEVRRRMAAALRAVGGATSAGEQNREIWLVTVTPSGEALARAAAQVVDEIADQARAHLPDL